ncbi:MAG: N-acetylmuramoyl-L-alanine amidase [Stenotrophobium sp.]
MRFVLFSILLCFASLANAAELRALRLSDGPDSTRVMFELSGSNTPYKIFTLTNPDRVVIDIAGVDKGGVALVDRSTGNGYVKRLRSAERSDGTLRVVLDVSQPVDPKSSGMVATGGYGYRLELDLTAKSTAPVILAPSSQVSTASKLATLPDAKTSQAPVTRLAAKQIVIAIDPGHGGEDPGAHGPSGLLEKNVSLSIARKLAKLVDEQPGMKAVLTRDGDYYVGLRQRIDIARKAQADLFISIHCNAFPHHDMHGTAVYVLSNKGVTGEQARWLANQENAADMVGGIDIQDKDHALAAVLIDLSQSATLEASFDVGKRMLDSMGQINALQKPRVQQAAFVVLKAPDIPSVLVETAFITNPHDERLLASDGYREKISQQLLSGIKGYFQHYRPQRQMVDNGGDATSAAADDLSYGPARPVAVSYEQKTARREKEDTSR